MKCPAKRSQNHNRASGRTSQCFQRRPCDSVHALKSPVMSNVHFGARPVSTPRFIFIKASDSTFVFKATLCPRTFHPQSDAHNKRKILNFMAVSSIRFVCMHVYGSSSNGRSRTVFFRIRAGFRTRTTAYTRLFHRAILRYAVSFEMSIRLIFGKFPPRSSTRRVLHVVGCTKRKCGAVFVHLQRGSDKTQNRINECFTPHLNRYENCGAKLFWPNLSKQENECCSLPRFTLKLSDFFVRTE